MARGGAWRGGWAKFRDMGSRVWKAFAVAVVAGLLPTGAAAQAGALTGVVRDTSGAPVVAALVTAERVAGGGAAGGPAARAGVPTPPASGGGPARRTAEADSAGRWRLAGLAPGEYRLRVERLGYRPAERTVTLAAGGVQQVDFALVAAALDIAPVSVEVARERQRFSADAGATSRRLAGSDIKRVPGLAEADVIRAVQVLPGVITTSDFSSAFHVRGGSADENLILLDGFPVYNPFHLGGLFGVFNSDMVSGAELLAGGFPASYGGRVSSVLNVESDPGAAGAGVQGAGGVSLLASRLALGADLPTGLARAAGLRSARGRVSFRRSYFDALLKPVADFPYHLTDVQGFFEGWTPGGGRFTLTGYTGGDVLDFSHPSSESFPLKLRMDWGNDMLGARWTGGAGPGRMLDLRAGYSRFGAAIRFPEFADTRFESRISQATAQASMKVDARPWLALEGGVGGDRMAYRSLATTGGTDFRNDGDAGWLASGYAQAQWRVPGWLLDTGVRADGWFPGSAPGRWLVSPRLGLKRFLAGGDAALNLSFGRYTQVVQSARDEEVPIGIDVWQLAGDRVPPVLSKQVQAGVESFRPAGWHLALEGFDRRFQGVIGFNAAADPNDARQEFVAGSGRSYGADVLVKRERGSVTGWISASWLRATRTFPDVLSGIDPAPSITYAPIFDRRLDFEGVLRFPLPGRVEAGVHASYGSGLPYTRPIAAYEIFEYNVGTGRRSRPDSPRDSAETAILLGPRNSVRYPAYVRLDASLRKTIRKRWGLLSPYIDVLNVTNRKNVLFYFYEYNRNPPTRTGVSMFPLLPSVGVEATF